jgi:hypothetical protein
MFAKFARNFKGKKKHSNEKLNMIVRMANTTILSTLLDNQKLNPDPRVKGKA